MHFKKEKKKQTLERVGFFEFSDTVCLRKIRYSVTNSISKIMRLVENMAEEEGFEPPRALTPLSVFKTDPFSRAWVFLRVQQNII
jgi:hypothetical protein